MIPGSDIKVCVYVCVYADVCMCEFARVCMRAPVNERVSVKDMVSPESLTTAENDGCLMRDVALVKLLADILFNYAEKNVKATSFPHFQQFAAIYLIASVTLIDCYKKRKIFARRSDIPH